LGDYDAMRLLQVEGDGNFVLLEFIEGSEIPQFAILSHRWGADHEEVTFKDIIEGTSRSKKGCNKIRKCAEQAALDGLNFFWIDTCCIKNIAQVTMPCKSGGNCHQVRLS
jgi:hypothetical protein